MGSLKLDDRVTDYQWASDVNFEGIRLEVLSDDGSVLFDVSIPDDGRLSIKTFGEDVPVDLIEAAIGIARRPR